MKKPTIITLSLLALTLSITSIQAKIYKWTDANGAVHYSATPPKANKKSKIEVKDIEDKIRFAAGKPRASSSKQSIEGPVSEGKNEKESSKLAPPSPKRSVCFNSHSVIRSCTNFLPISKRTDLYWRGVIRGITLP